MPESSSHFNLTAQPDIWAENSPAVVQIRQRYERAGLQTWNNARVSKLACDLNWTIWTLAAEAGAFTTFYDAKFDMFRLKLDKGLIQRAWKKNHWPVSLTVNFDRLEKYVQARDGKGPGLMLGAADRASAKIIAGGFCG